MGLRLRRTLFWEYDTTALDAERDRALIVERTLSRGTWREVKQLRKRLGDATLRRLISERRGRGLSNRQLRYWELVLGLPHRTVTRWIEHPTRKLWHGRSGHGSPTRGTH